MSREKRVGLVLQGIMKPDDELTRRLGATQAASLKAKYATLAAATVTVCILMVLVFVDFLAPAFGHLGSVSWGKYLFFVLFEACMTLAFGALFQGFLILRGSVRATRMWA